MNKLNMFFIEIMIIGLLITSIATLTENPLLVAIIGYILCIGSSIGYALTTS